MSTDPTPLDVLAAGIPLTLLIDLFVAPNSAQLLVEEGGSADWLPATVRKTA
jgi:hypothetical protein